MTFEKKFKEIKKELEKRDSKNLRPDLAVQITMDDEDCGGTFYVSNMDGKFEVAPYDYQDNTLYINTTAKVLDDLLNGKLDAPDAIFRGLLTGEGEWEHGLEVLNMPKKPAAKKSAAKKPAAKKPAAKKTAAKKPAAKKTTTKKAAEKKAAAPKKAAEKKAATEKKTATKSAAKKPAAKKTAAKK